VEQVPKTSDGYADRQKLKTWLRKSDVLLRQFIWWEVCQCRMPLSKIIPAAMWAMFTHNNSQESKRWFGVQLDSAARWSGHQRQPPDRPFSHMRVALTELLWRYLIRKVSRCDLPCDGQIASSENLTASVPVLDTYKKYESTSEASMRSMNKNNHRRTNESDTTRTQ